MNYDSTGTAERWPIHPWHARQLTVTQSLGDSYLHLFTGGYGFRRNVLYLDLTRATAAPVLALRALAGSILEWQQISRCRRSALLCPAAAPVARLCLSVHRTAICAQQADGRQVGGRRHGGMAPAHRRRLRRVLCRCRSGPAAAVRPSAARCRLGVEARRCALLHTSIGAVRLDVAVPVKRLPGGDSFRLYIGLGQAF